MSDISANIQKVRGRIQKAAARSGRNPGTVKLLVVTKKVPAEKIQEAVAAGVTLIGENRIQEAREKVPKLHGDICCHLIGHLQENKIKYIFDLFRMVHSVDSLALAREMDKRAGAKGTTIAVLVQVNVSGEKTKFGISPDNVVEMMREMAALDNISVKGLMTIPPFSDNPEDSRPFFRRLATIKAEVEQEGIEGVTMQELSMGMSNDFEIAIEEGATMVRVGSAVFGERK